jgi:2-succinyl-5-enolpyruvyl-6-hydroxy-3-cyclohexene-1-carboxylate synthase
MSAFAGVTAAATASRNATAAGALVGALVHAGVHDFVVSPGSRSAPLALACVEHASARVHVCVDERAAGFFALGLARASGRPAALVCTSGSAGAHYLPALVEASLSRIPLVVLTADRPPELHHVGAPQTIAQERLFGDFVRWRAVLPPPSARVPLAWVRAVAVQALAAAERAPAGPVHLDVAFREPLWSPEARAGEGPAPPRLRAGAARLDDTALAALARDLAGAERGLVVCGPRRGPLAGADRFARAVGRLGEALGWPVLADAASGVRFGPAAPCVVGEHEILLRSAAFAAARSPDLVLRFGLAPISSALGAWLDGQDGARSIVVDEAGAYADPGSRSTEMVLAEETRLCEALADALGGLGRREGSWGEAWRRAALVARTALERLTGDWEGGVVRALRAALPEGALLHVGNSLAVRALDGLGGTGGRRIGVAVHRGASGIDGAVAAAAGAAHAWPGPTFALLGDLSLWHDLDGLAAAAETGAPLCAIVLDNGGGGIFDTLAVAGHPTAYERLFLTPRTLALAPLAEALGAQFVEATDVEALVRRHAAAPRLTLARVAVDRQTSRLRWDAARRDVERALADA